MLKAEVKTNNQRLVLALRRLMSAHGVLWKITRHDPVEPAKARAHLAEATRLRELAKQWEEKPV